MVSPAPSSDVRSDLVAHVVPTDPARASVAGKKPISERKLAANRANAQRSTGPRTAEGKARSRLNGLKHGLRASLPLDDTPEVQAILDVDPGAHRELRDALRKDLRPTTVREKLLVERLARAAWLARRADSVETELAQLARVMQRLDGLFRTALRELRQTRTTQAKSAKQTAGDAPPRPAPLTTRLLSCAPEPNAAPPRLDGSDAPRAG